MCIRKGAIILSSKLGYVDTVLEMCSIISDIDIWSTSV